MRIARGVLAVAYPFLLFAGLHWIEPRWIAAGIAIGFGVRALLAGRAGWDALAPWLLPAGLVAVVLVPTLWSNHPVALLFVPVLVNLGLLVAFGRTLRGGPSMIERFARLQDPELSTAQVDHCRAMTWIWCGFFVVNAAVSAGLALAGDLAAWTLYTGFLAYLLMGVLFVGEWFVRAWRFRKYEGSFAEPLLRRWFPPEPSA
ncbi:MAG: hypothetical protein AAF430_00720 [Myxococcota bacterium]